MHPEQLFNPTIENNKRLPRKWGYISFMSCKYMYINDQYSIKQTMYLSIGICLIFGGEVLG